MSTEGAAHHGHHLQLRNPGLNFCASRENSAAAARLRAKFNLKTPDAVQAASALASQATGFISNDPVFRRLQSLDVLILDDLLLI